MNFFDLRRNIIVRIKLIKLVMALISIQEEKRMHVCYNFILHSSFFRHNWKFKIMNLIKIFICNLVFRFLIFCVNRRWCRCYRDNKCWMWMEMYSERRVRGYRLTLDDRFDCQTVMKRWQTRWAHCKCGCLAEISLNYRNRWYNSLLELSWHTNPGICLPTLWLLPFF